MLFQRGFRLNLAPMALRREGAGAGSGDSGRLITGAEAGYRVRGRR